MLRISILLGSTLACLEKHASALTLTFQERNFSIEIPDGWEQLPKYPKDLIALRSPDGLKEVVVTAIRLPKIGSDKFAKNYIDSVFTAFIVRGGHIKTEEVRKIAGITFKLNEASEAEFNAVFLNTVAGNEDYLIRLSMHGGLPLLDPEFQEIIESFKLLSKP